MQKWKKVTIIQHKTNLSDPPTRLIKKVVVGVTQDRAEGGQAQGHREVKRGAGQHEGGEEGQDGADAGQGQELHQERPDIRERIRRHPDIIVADSPANRPARNRKCQPIKRPGQPTRGGGENKPG